MDAVMRKEVICVIPRRLSVPFGDLQYKAPGFQALQFFHLCRCVKDPQKQTGHTYRKVNENKYVV